MKLPWKRDSTSDQDVDVLLAEAHAATPPSGPFRMTVADVFRITGRGTVATGTVESGSVAVKQDVRVVRDGSILGSTTVTGVEMFRKKVDVASAGENVGLLVSGDVGDSLAPGDVLES
ncbi:translation elongation factor EF-Tu-like GTPase [Marmoricola sp. OAE513]